jgi:hypothetical protein
MKHLDEAAERGWSIVHHEVSAEKDGNIFKGSPEDVLARVTRFQAHGDYAQAIAEAAQRKTQHEEIDRLLRRVKLQAEEYTRQFDDYKKRCSDRSDRRAHAAGLLSLRKATDALVLIGQTFEQVLGFPRDVLLENEQHCAVRDVLWGGPEWRTQSIPE